MLTCITSFRNRSITHYLLHYMWRNMWAYVLSHISEVFWTPLLQLSHKYGCFTHTFIHSVTKMCTPTPTPFPYLFDVICICSRATNLLEGPNSQNGEWEKTNIAEQVQAINDMVERFLLVYLDIQDRSRGKRQQYTRQHLNHTVAHCLQWLTNFFTEFQWQLQCSLLCVTSFK